MNEILVPTAPGELIDKLTILRLKVEKIADPAKLIHVQHELKVLEGIADRLLPDDEKLQDLWDELFRINGDLWQIEDDIRTFEARGDFSEGFIALARSVYLTNDRRAAVKKEINLLLGSAIVEEKSYSSPEEGA